MIIGLIGRAGSGKDFTFDYYHRAGFAIQRRAWADELRFEIQESLNGGVWMDALWRKPYPEEVRRLLQWWGTEFRRAQDPDYWVNKMKSELIPFAKGGPLADQGVFVTDCRYPNEIDAIKTMGGTVVRVWASERERVRRLGHLPPDHLSETALDRYRADITLNSKNGIVAGYTDEDARKWAAVLAQITFNGGDVR